MGKLKNQRFYLLVHICCSVDSHYFLERIQEEYPNEEMVGFFYDPNIHPYNEYRLRYLDVEYSCKKLGIKLLEGPYNLEEWLKKVKGLENEPEKGDKFTTSLLISPKKSQDKLEKIGANLTQKYNCEFIFKDYRSGSGTQEQGQIVKENSLYRQNYCGCLFGLTQQREQQKKLMDEMFSPISNQILPESIESRLEIYKRRDELEQKDIPYKIVKQRFLNYRVLSGLTKIDKKIVPSYFLCYSTLNRNKMNGRIEYEKDGIAHLNRDEVKVLSLKKFNELGNSSYNSVKELIFNPPTFESELNIRNKITNSAYDLSTIIILNETLDGKYEIQLDAQTYDDVKEVLI